MTLIGAFRLEGPGGAQVTISSKKATALLAMLATSPNGERSRVWLQERLWGSRGASQASASMRRELSNLRKTLEEAGADLIEAESGRVRLRLESVDCDVLRVDRDGWARANRSADDAEFMEGLDIKGEDDFVEWLSGLRTSLSAQRASPAKTAKNVHVSLPPQRERFDTLPTDAAATLLLAPLDERNLEGRSSPRARAFADALQRLLTRTRWLRVAPVASQRPGGVDPQAAERGHYYLIEPIASSDGEAESIEVRLSTPAALLWSERQAFSGSIDNAKRAVQLAARLIARIEREEQLAAIRSTNRANDFRNLIWRGRWHVNRLTRQDSEVAIELFDRALALAPDSAEAVIQRATAHAWENWARRMPRERFGALRDMAGRAVLLDPDDCRGYWIAGIAEIWLGNAASAINWIRQSIDINEAFEPAYAQLGCALNLLDRPDEAAEALEFALELSPQDTHLFFRHTELALSHLLARRFDRSVEWADRALVLRPGYWYAQSIKAHALVEMGDLVAAAELGAEMRRLHPKFRREYLEWVPFVDRSWVDRLLNSVRIAMKESDRSSQ